MLLLVLGLGFLGYALYTGLSRESGWTEIEPVQAYSDSVAVDFVLLYELGASGRATNAEYRDISTLYSELCAKAYQLFHTYETFDDVVNICYINQHPGEILTVDPVLYDAFTTLQASGSRILYAAPYYTSYQNLFLDTEDASAALVDPYKNDALAADFSALSVFIQEPDHVTLELLGNNQVRLNLSDAYKTYAQENFVQQFIDFYWTRNAFVADYIAEEMLSKGFPYGTISSFDGFTRAFDTRTSRFNHDLYTMVGGKSYQAARLVCQGSTALVSLRAFRVNERDEAYYAYGDGTLRHPYIDPADGLCKNSLPSLVAYSQSKSCAQVLLEVLPVYMSNTFDNAGLMQAKENGTHCVWFNGTQVVYNDSAATIHDFYTDSEIQFTPNKLS